MTADLSRVDEWIYQSLVIDPTVASLVGTRIYADEAPQGSLSPLIVFAFLGGGDRLITLKARLTSALYLIRAVDQNSSYELISPIADRIDDILINALPDRGTVVRDTRVTSCFREQPHQRKDSSEGVPVVYLGGFYRISFQPALQ